LTKIIKTYRNDEEYRQDVMIGFRALHQDHINLELRVTWVNGSDNPSNDIVQKRSLTQRAFIQEIAALQDVDIT